VSGPSVALDDKGLPAGYLFRADVEITPREVRDLLKTGGVFLIDCRSAAEAKLARIAGAVLIPMEELANRVEEIEAAAGEKRIVVHCHMGGRSMKSVFFLRSRGVNAASMAGGIDLWALDIDPKVPRY
jgi:rhodanese-related sulfurtransferase